MSLIRAIAGAVLTLALGLGTARAETDVVPPVLTHALGDTPGAVGPGTIRATLPAVTPEESERIIAARSARGAALRAGAPAPSAVLAAAEAAPATPAKLVELARALKHDPELIYRYVHDTIEYYPIWGTQKGALGTLLDGRGTAFDQAALMVALLRESGFEASYVKGQIRLTGDQIHAWLGIDIAYDCAVANLFADGGLPIASVNGLPSGYCSGSPLSSLVISHLWVKVQIDGSAYVFDPSFKSHDFKGGIELATAAGYDPVAYLTAARNGAAISAGSVQGLDRGAIRGNLIAYASNLASYLRTNLPSATLADAIGGQTIRRTDPDELGKPRLRQSDLPYTGMSRPRSPSGRRSPTPTSPACGSSTPASTAPSPAMKSTPGA